MVAEPRSNNLLSSTSVIYEKKHSDMNELRATFTYVAPVFRVSDLE
jgi:hypothetical protein